jgi:hypothetical protein
VEVEVLVLLAIVAIGELEELGGQASIAPVMESPAMAVVPGVQAVAWEIITSVT